MRFFIYKGINYFRGGVNYKFVGIVGMVYLYNFLYNFKVDSFNGFYGVLFFINRVFIV